MARRLGFDDANESVYKLINEWLDLLMKEELDYNESFLRLTYGDKREKWSDAFAALYEKSSTPQGMQATGFAAQTIPPFSREIT